MRQPGLAWLFGVTRFETDHSDGQSVIHTNPTNFQHGLNQAD